MSLKTYVLLPETRPSAPIYAVINKNRIKNNSLPRWRPNLQYTFQDEDGVNVTTRFKLNSNTIFQDKQIKDENIPANAKFTTAERNKLKFTNGVLVIDSKIAQDFLENGCPEFNDFKGKTDDLKRPMFEVYDKVAEVKNQNQLTKKTIKAASQIMSMNEDEAKSLLIRINGVGYTPPVDLEEAQNALIDYMDSSEEAVDNILKKTTTSKEDVDVLIGSLVAIGILSFDAKPNEVNKKYGNGWQKVMDLSSTDYTLEQRAELLSEFLLKEEGKPMLESLQNSFEKSKTKTV